MTNLKFRIFNLDVDFYYGETVVLQTTSIWQQAAPIIAPVIDASDHAIQYYAVTSGGKSWVDEIACFEDLKQNTNQLRASGQNHGQAKTKSSKNFHGG